MIISIIIALIERPYVLDVVCFAYIISPTFSVRSG